MKDVRAKISTLWVVVMFNMLFADVLTLYIPEHLQDTLSGSTGVEITEGLMLAMAFLIEIPIVMIFLARILKYRSNRIANLVACTITAVFIVAGGSLILHYLFFAAIELACLAMIAWYTWQWRDPELEAVTPDRGFATTSY